MKKSNVILVLAFCSLLCHADEVLQPGGLEPTTLSDGTPAVGIDLASLAGKSERPWYKRAWASTTNNMVNHTGIWASGGVIGLLSASSTVRDFVGLDEDNKDKKVINPNPKEKPVAAINVQGVGNTVVVPSDSVSSSPIVSVNGQNNTVTVTDSNKDR